jgi:hypothetical protein
MTHQHNSAVLTLPLAAVERTLQEVESWSCFLTGVEHIDRAAHERYVFSLSGSGHPREVRVVVRAHPRRHRFTWKALAGPPVDGYLQLTPLPGGWTRVDFDATARPARALEYLAEIVGAGPSNRVVDVVRLQEHLADGRHRGSAHPA